MPYNIGAPEDAIQGLTYVARITVFDVYAVQSFGFHAVLLIHYSYMLPDCDLGAIQII